MFEFCVNKFKTYHRGFTLIELLVIIGLLAVLSGLSVPPLIQWVKGKRVSEASNQLVQILNYAREKSISSGVAYKIVFENSNSGVGIKISTESTPTGSLDCTTAGDWVDDPLQPDKIILAGKEKIKFTSSLNSTCFYSHGGSMELIIEIADVTSADSNKKKIQIYGATGYIETSTWKDNEWKIQ